MDLLTKKVAFLKSAIVSGSGKKSESLQLQDQISIQKEEIKMCFNSPDGERRSSKNNSHSYVRKDNYQPIVKSNKVGGCSGMNSIIEVSSSDVTVKKKKKNKNKNKKKKSVSDTQTGVLPHLHKNIFMLSYFSQIKFFLSFSISY